MKTMLALIVVTITGCASIQNVGDLFASVDKLNEKCHDGVTKLALKGINIYSFEQCDAAAAKQKENIQELLDKVRAELAKAGV